MPAHGQRQAGIPGSAGQADRLPRPGPRPGIRADTAVSPVRRTRFCATRAWRASCWWHREVRCRCRSSAEDALLHLARPAAV